MQCGFPLFFLAECPGWQRQGGGAFSPVYSIPCTLFRKCFYLFGGEYPPFVGKTLSFAHSFINNVVVTVIFQWIWAPTYNFSRCSSIMGRSRGERGAAWVGLISQLDFKPAHRADYCALFLPQHLTFHLLLVMALEPRQVNPHNTSLALFPFSLIHLRDWLHWAIS